MESAVAFGYQVMNDLHNATFIVRASPCLTPPPPPSLPFPSLPPLETISPFSHYWSEMGGD